MKDSGDQRIGPGPNYWSDDLESVWVDQDGNLHLKLRKIDGEWHCAEVYLPDSLGFGRYTFEVIGRVDELDKNVVGAAFAYLNDEAEIDVEFARWSVEDRENGQYVVQPGSEPGHLHAFDVQLNGTHSTHQFGWKPSHVRFQSIHGHHRVPPRPRHEIQSWAFEQASDVPTGDLRPHINLWLNAGMSPSNGEQAELIVKSFEFTPYASGNNPPVRPYASVPGDGTAGTSLMPTLLSSVYSDPNLDGHKASQWQIRTAGDNDRNDIVWDSGVDRINPTDITVPSNVLAPDTAYTWRVRHQDSESAWSAWSEEANFTTTTDSTATFRVARDGDVYADGALKSGGADLAERAVVSEPIDPGDVVAIDPANPGNYRKTRRAYSSLATGVIASEPGVVLGDEAATRLAFPLRQPLLPFPLSPSVMASSSVTFSLPRLVPSPNVPVSNNRPVLALMGQVPVKATAANGSIQPGDLLVSAAQPGYAMRCDVPDDCQGAIIGKALEALSEGPGRILMLVMR